MGVSLSHFLRMFLSISAVPSAASLYADAVDLIPSNFTYALNHIHALETMCDYNGAVNALEICLKRNSSFCIWRRTPLPTSPVVVTSLDSLSKSNSIVLPSKSPLGEPFSISAGQILDLLHDLRKLPSLKSVRCHRHAVHPLNHLLVYEHLQSRIDISPSLSLSSILLSLFPLGNVVSQLSLLTITAFVSDFTPDELDFLAILFSLVKLLFLSCTLSPLPSLILLIGITRDSHFSSA
jgi:hypothetical protein